MPRKTKDEGNLMEEKTVKKEAISKKVTTKKASSAKEKKDSANSVKKSAKTSNKTPSKDTKSANSSKTAKATKKTSDKAAKTVSKKSSKTTDETVSSKKKTSTKSGTTSKKASTKKTSTSSKKNTTKKIEVVEYYDLPYRYNQTVVKVLAQTPNTLFVYWDISDDDRKKYTQQYGEYFFHDTKPVLIVHNKTKNYNFEIDINDFANSWYLHLIDSDCDYQVELGRRPINEYANISNNYLHITASNEIESPNDHILFDHLNNNVYFRNIKTNYTIKKESVNLSLLKKIGNISTIKAFYQELYPDEKINLDRLSLSNPSSK